MSAKGAPPTRYVIPVEPIRRVMREWIEREMKSYVADRNDLERPLHPRQRLIELIWPNGHVAKNGERDTKRFDQLMYDQQWVDFDFADRVLTRLNLTHLWAVDDELRALYESVDLDALDLTRPTCDKVALEAARLVNGLLVQGVTLKSISERLHVGRKTVLGLADPVIADAAKRAAWARNGMKAVAA